MTIRCGRHPEPQRQIGRTAGKPGPGRCKPAQELHGRRVRLPHARKVQNGPRGRVTAGDHELREAFDFKPPIDLDDRCLPVQ